MRIEYIHAVAAIHAGHSIHLPDSGNILLCHADGRHNLQIHEIIVIKISIRSIFHHRYTVPYSGEEGDSDADDGKDGKEATEGFADFPQGIFQKGFLFHISIQSFLPVKDAH